ncbi:MAG: hypothetical protein CVT95_12850 [Bacteroidetes bacterium HGW-Bacteroidetes-12]|nr:MAG: hypothetical protein CVT95_12850 [Bacteroidetes bacterium HGW-Bacteroidetes-12]
MGKIQSISDLEDAILLLKNKRLEEEKMLKEIFNQTYESIKPINIIKNIFREIVEPQNLKDSLVSTSVGLGLGYLSKILFQRIVKVPFKKFFGSALMLSVENLVAKYPEVVTTIANFFLNTFSKKSDKDDSKEVDYEDIHREVKTDPIDLETIY